MALNLHSKVNKHYVICSDKVRNFLKTGTEIITLSETKTFLLNLFSQVSRGGCNISLLTWLHNTLLVPARRAELRRQRNSRLLTGRLMEWGRDIWLTPDYLTLAFMKNEKLLFFMKFLSLEIPFIFSLRQ